MSDVDQLLSVAFDRPRSPRSEAYKRGCRALLARKIDATPMRCPYVAGTAESDAWYAGVAEGHTIWDEQRPIPTPGNPARSKRIGNATVSERSPRDGEALAN